MADGEGLSTRIRCLVYLQLEALMADKMERRALSWSCRTERDLINDGVERNWRYIRHLFTIHIHR
jgi:hypothetical protein